MFDLKQNWFGNANRNDGQMHMASSEATFPSTNKKKIGQINRLNHRLTRENTEVVLRRKCPIVPFWEKYGLDQSTRYNKGR